MVMFWDNFNRLCEINGKTPNAVARELGISSGAVTHWKKSGKNPNGKTIDKIASYFGVSVDYLLNGVDSMNTLTDIEQKAVRLLRKMSPDKQKYAIGRLEEMVHEESVAAETDQPLKVAK